METVQVQEALFLLDKVHLFAIQNEGDGNLQHTIRGAANLVKGITIRSKNQTSFLIFLPSLSVFYNMFMLYWSSRVKSAVVLNMAYFLTLFVRKCLHILIEQTKS